MHLGQYRRHLDSLFPRNSNLETNLGCDPILSPRGHEVAERPNDAVLGWYRQSDPGRSDRIDRPACLENPRPEGGTIPVSPAAGLMITLNQNSLQGPIGRVQRIGIDGDRVIYRQGDGPIEALDTVYNRQQSHWPEAICGILALALLVLYLTRVQIRSSAWGVKPC